MPISRRNLLRAIGLGAAATAAIPSLAELSFGNSRTLGNFGASATDLLNAGRAGSVPPSAPIILSRNENSYGPSEKVLAAMREALHMANRYPDDDENALANKIAALHGVKREQVVLGCGSGEILRMSAEAFLGSGKTLIVALPTFEALGHHAQRMGAEVVAVPVSKNWSHDLDAMLARSDAPTGLVYICNPNNPTGSLTPRRDLETFIKKLPANTHVLIDEAYHHFVGGTPDYVSFIDRPIDDKRIIVARTFSKIYGMAGMRVGYAIAAQPTALALGEHRLANSVNIVAAKAAGIALDDMEHVRMSTKRNASDRQEFFQQASARKVPAIDSQANFVMLNAGRPTTEVIEHFRKNGILVARRFPPLDTCVRVSLGMPPEMTEFWKVWDMMPEKMTT
ncbi:MAG TPA: histidinol-phosphate transaminase [Candidatus Dormibacteraeota bacterium]|nr:histidinol-phosphate transaminase [Candidatus Dormibacteraeota bacterium]